MLTLLLILLAGTLAGALGGSLVAWFLTRRHERRKEPEPTPPPDPWPDFDIDQAAIAWATAHGRPEASRVVADKLRLLYGLARSRQRRRQRRWSR
jgi:hypothetical protein